MAKTPSVWMIVVSANSVPAISWLMLPVTLAAA